MNENEIIKSEPFSLKSFKEQYKVGDIISFKTKDTKINGMITALIESEDLNVPDSVIIGNLAFTFDDLYHFTDDDGNPIGVHHVYRKVDNEPKVRKMTEDEFMNLFKNFY